MKTEVETLKALLRQAYTEIKLHNSEYKYVTEQAFLDEIEKVVGIDPKLQPYGHYS